MFPSSGKLQNVMIGNVYPLRQLQGEKSWFSPLPRNVCAEHSQEVQMQWRPALGVPRPVLGSHSLNARHFCELDQSIDESVLTYDLQPGTELGFGVERESELS